MDFKKADLQIFSSPFLACIETACGVFKGLDTQLNQDKITVFDQLSDVLLDSWYREDPFIGLATKLVLNKP